ncbi:MAG: hypothetical protein OXU53_00645 [Deltaproteobacteria bacterium]|nr:hypothetical protein [Deltaproteobacteria bacterium]
MERTQKTWILEIVLAAILAALVGIAGWTATKVIENGERIVEVKAELQKEIAENGKKIAALDAKMDLLIRGLNISVTPKESASAEPSGAESGGFQVGAGGTATE